MLHVNRTSLMNRLAIALLATGLCVSCRSSGPQAAASRKGEAGSAGRYSFSAPDLRIDLDISPDGTYYASMDSWARLSQERGVWCIGGDNVVLKRQSGGLQMPIRQLGPVRQDGADMWHIVDPDSQVGRAMIFTRVGL